LIFDGAGSHAAPFVFVVNSSGVPACHANPLESCHEQPWIDYSIATYDVFIRVTGKYDQEQL
jgi:hypothetical protein